ncbi:heterokaryon incompatibility protein-domain-containing protein [Bisporella sp. PMI_857]|nr:heterokaryon incompatibility protein-domain-containing protein [Bisporella sp. PMI_857]
MKCQACRISKQKCLPENRVWPNKCQRCISRGLPCSPPQKPLRSDGHHVSPSEEPVSEPTSPNAGSEGSDIDEEIHHRLPTNLVSLRKRFSRPHVARKQNPNRIAWIDAVRKVQARHRLLEYKHQPLSPGTDIRLLVIHPGEGKSAIYCHLEETVFPKEGVLSGTRPYFALSYDWGWGIDDPNHEIRILDVSPYRKIMSMADAAWAFYSSKKIYIRPNLFNALQQLRSSKESVVLWVDALCIDGQSYEEKGSQVAKMPATFGNAEEVYIWLGSATATSHLAMSFIPQMLNLGRFDDYISDLNVIEKWRAFADLMKHRWFSRRWVLQEVVLAKKATMHCGSESVEWSDFATAVALYNTGFYQIKELFRVSGKYSHTPDLLNDSNGASVFTNATSNLVQRSSDGAVIKRRCSIEVLVTTLSALKTSHLSDTIYALIPLAKDASNIKIDYSKDSVDVFVDFVAQCIKSSQSLDIICRHWAPTALDGISSPTWILSASGSPFGDSSQFWGDRVNGDSFVGTPGSPIYNASAGIGLPLDIATVGYSLTGNIVDVAPRTILAKGIQIDTISELGARSIQGIIYRETLEMGGLRMSGRDDRFDRSAVPDALWRTLVADRGADGNRPPPWYRQAFLHCLDFVTLDHDIMTPTLVEHSPRLVKEFLRRVQAVIWNRKFFQTRERSLFGLAPSQARHGDIVCILSGCSVPVVLRKYQYRPISGSVLRAPEYEFVGECYVHGLMDGEAKEMMGCETEFIQLV